MATFNSLINVIKPRLGLQKLFNSAVFLLGLLTVHPVQGQTPPACGTAGYSLVNGGFESPVVPVTNYFYYVANANSPGWKSTEGKVEYWSLGLGGVTCSVGRQCAEINADTFGTLYQDISAFPGDTLVFSFLHRGRLKNDSCYAKIGPPSNMTTLSFFTTGLAWKRYVLSWTVPPGVTQIRLAFEAEPIGTQGFGNVLDDVNLTPARCLPTPALAPSCSADNGYSVINGGFEEPIVNQTASNELFPAWRVPAWRSTEGQIELWSSGFANTTPVEGKQVAEMQGEVPGTLYQDIFSYPGEYLVFTFSHKGRDGPDTCSVMIGPPSNMSVLGYFTTNNTAWKSYLVAYTVPPGVNLIRIAFRAVSSYGGVLNVGNVIDNVVLKPARCITPLPTTTPLNCSDLGPLQLINGGFETPSLPLTDGEPNFYFIPNSNVSGWRSTEGKVEFWNSGSSNVTCSEGKQCAEIQAETMGTLYQDILVVPLKPLQLVFSHRGRNGTDTCRVKIGPLGGTSVSLGDFTTGTTWRRYTVTYTPPASSTYLRLSFDSISTSSGLPSQGNVLDNVMLVPLECWNECASDAHNCDALAMCTDTTSSFTCACNKGYTGNGLNCTDINECVGGNNTCSTNAVCNNTVGSYTCACAAGYTGNGVTCTDVNECSTGGHVCGTTSTCTNTAGSYACACNSGYTGNGVTCTDINECATGNNTCSTNAVCNNTAGSYTCACAAGYTGNGVTCTDVNECSTGGHVCGTTSTCTNTAGSYTCACNSGYTGNGVTCTAPVSSIKIFENIGCTNPPISTSTATDVSACAAKCKSDTGCVMFSYASASKACKTYTGCSSPDPSATGVDLYGFNAVRR